MMNHDVLCVREMRKVDLLEGRRKRNNNNVRKKTIPKRRQGQAEKVVKNC